MAKTIEDLREILFKAIDGVRTGELDIERAKVISDLSQVMVNSAKAEVDYARVTGEKDSSFLKPEPELPAGITGRTVHKLR